MLCTVQLKAQDITPEAFAPYGQARAAAGQARGLLASLRLAAAARLPAGMSRAPRTLRRSRARAPQPAQVVGPSEDGEPYGPGDARLSLDGGQPRCAAPPRPACSGGPTAPCLSACPAWQPGSPRLLLLTAAAPLPPASPFSLRARTHTHHTHMPSPSPRRSFYIMRLPHRGRRFERITFHGGCTQCLGALAPAAPWYLVVAPPSGSVRRRPAEQVRVGSAGRRYAGAGLYAGSHWAARWAGAGTRWAELALAQGLGIALAPLLGTALLYEGTAPDGSRCAHDLDLSPSHPSPWAAGPGGVPNPSWRLCQIGEGHVARWCAGLGSGAQPAPGSALAPVPHPAAPHQAQPPGRAAPRRARRLLPRRPSRSALRCTALHCAAPSPLQQSPYPPPPLPTSTHPHRVCHPLRAGPLFDSSSQDFYNLELADTNVVDHNTWHYARDEGLRFEVVD